MDLTSLPSLVNDPGFSLNSSQVWAIRKALQDNLRKAQTVGYQTGASSNPDGGSLAALLPQSIDAELATIPYTEKDLVFHKMLPTDEASQTLQEIRFRQSHGDKLLDKNTSEGEITGNNQSSYGYRSLRMKFWVEARELTDVASALTGIGVPAGMMAEATQEAGLELLRSIEQDDLFGDSSLNSLKPDGIFRQIETDIATGGNGSEVASRIDDLGGQQLSMEYLEYRLAELVQPNVAASPTVFICTPRVFRDLSIEQNARYREQMGPDAARAMTMGYSKINILGPKGEVPVVAVPFLDEQLWIGGAPAAAGGISDKRPKVPALTNANPNPVVSGAGKASTAEAGLYQYKIVGCNEFGYSVPLTVANVTVAVGKSVEFKIDADPNNANSVPFPTYFRIYRSDKNGDATTCKFVRSIKATAANAVFSVIDDFSVKANTSKGAFLRMDKKEIAFYKLLPTARVPLAKTKLTQPFVIFASGALAVKVPEHQFVVRNIGVSNRKPAIPA